MADHRMAEAAITSAFDDAQQNPAAAGVYAQVAIAHALLAVADEIKSLAETLTHDD